MTYKIVGISLGGKFGKLTAIKFVKREYKIGEIWLFRCDCGGEKEFIKYNVQKGISKSCGCLQKELLIKRSVKHGLHKTPFYNVWATIKQRCFTKHAH